MKKLILLILPLLAISGCKDVISKNISKSTPISIIPYNNDTVAVNPVHFKWEEMDGATEYRLAIVRPSFDKIEEYVLDSTIYATSFYMALDSNQYEYRLTAMNSGYTSLSTSPIRFWVGTNADLSNGTVVLSKPTNNAYKDETFSKNFSWNALNSVSSYEFSLRKGSDFGSGTILHNQNQISTLNITVPSSVTMDEGIYFWGVKAYLTNGKETLFSTFQLSIDTVKPNIPLLISPQDNAFLTAGSTNFSWNNGTDPGIVHAPVYSLLEISSDQNFTSIIESANIVGTDTSITIATGSFYWRVTNTDEAGNTNTPSSSNFFTVN
jgi:hypothetical protein